MKNYVKLRFLSSIKVDQKKRIQIIQLKIEKTPNSSEYLLNETKIRKLLDEHHGILPILDYGIYKSRRFIIYSFIDSTLYKKLDSTTLSFLMCISAY